MFRPMLETLEKREVCAADLQAAVSPAEVAEAAETQPLEVAVLEAASLRQAELAARAVSVPALDGGSKEAAFFAHAAQLASDGAFIEKLALGHVLPYIEQDNLFKQYTRTAQGDDAARDEVFQQIGRLGESPYVGQPQGIIAILIGLAADPKDSLPLGGGLR